MKGASQGTVPTASAAIGRAGGSAGSQIWRHEAPPLGECSSGIPRIFLSSSEGTPCMSLLCSTLQGTRKVLGMVGGWERSLKVTRGWGQGKSHDAWASPERLALWMCPEKVNRREIFPWASGSKKEEDRLLLGEGKNKGPPHQKVWRGDCHQVQTRGYSHLCVSGEGRHTCMPQGTVLGGRLGEWLCWAGSGVVHPANSHSKSLDGTAGSCPLGRPVIAKGNCLRKALVLGHALSGL